MRSRRLNRHSFLDLWIARLRLAWGWFWRNQIEKSKHGAGLLLAGRRALVRRRRGLRPALADRRRQPADEAVRDGRHVPGRLRRSDGALLAQLGRLLRARRRRRAAVHRLERDRRRPLLRGRPSRAALQTGALRSTAIALHALLLVRPQVCKLLELAQLSG